MFGFDTMVLLRWRDRRQWHDDASLSAALTNVKFALLRRAPVGKMCVSRYGLFTETDLPDWTRIPSPAFGKPLNAMVCQLECLTRQRIIRSMCFAGSQTACAGIV
jgi:hypothetical protein